MFRTILVLLTVFLSSQLYAGELHLVINGKAIHENKKNFNEENYGFGFEYDFDQQDDGWINFVTASYFLDSVNNISRYMGGGTKKRYKLGKGEGSWHFDAGVVAFLMTRYDYMDNKPFFGALPFVSLGNDYFAVNATYIPAITPKFEALMFFQATVKIASW